MTTSTPDLAKLQNLIATATNPRQKAMYQKLLEKANKQLVESQVASSTEKKRASHNKAKSKTKKLPKNQIETKNQKVEQKSEEFTQEVKEVKESTPDKSKAKSTKDKSNKNKSKGKSKTPELATTKKSSFRQKSKSEDSSESAVEAVEEEKPEKIKITFFQAIGVIEGTIDLEEDGQLSIAMKGQKYHLGYSGGKKKPIYDALLKEIEREGGSSKLISVYPQFKHDNQKKEYQLSFTLVGVSKSSKKKALFKKLEPGEFQVSGYWQYVPFCNLPCVAIKRNYTHNFAKLIKKLDKEKVKKFLRTTYVPVEWSEPRVEPFKYNPELDKKQQMLRYFVQLKLAFTPADNKFTVIEQIEDPTLEIPKYMKQ